MEKRITGEIMLQWALEIISVSQGLHFKFLRNTFFCIFLLQVSFAQGQLLEDKLINTIVYAFKSYDVNKAKKYISRLENEEIKKVFLFQYHYYNNGYFKEINLKEKNNSLSERGKIINNYIIGDFYKKRKTPNDSLAYLYYNEAFIKAKSNNDTILINAILPRISKHFFDYKDTYLSELKNCTRLYSFYAKDSVDNFWESYYNIVVKMATLENSSLSKNLKKIDFLNSDFKVAKNYANVSPFLKGKIYQLEGVFYNYIIKKHQKAASLFKKATFFYRQGNFYISQRGAFDNQVNFAIYLFNKKSYKKAIAIFEEELKTNYHEINLNTLNEKFIINKWLYRAYKKINNQSKTLFYLEKKDTLKDLLKKYEYSISMKKINQNSKVREKNEQLESIKKENKSLSTNLKTVLPILGFTTLILIFIFYLYKRYKKKSSVLEEEQSETLQKLDELKQIVIKNHIVLKDKTKVYISELMYIQSDDHYLKVFTQHGKNHFVRGKLSQIKEELPPNFIQCHRSYIVNSNFIKQIHANSIVLINKEEIPLSRSYKGEF